MRRLREEQGTTDPTIAAAAQLLRAVGPIEDADLRCRQIRKALRQRQVTRRPIRSLWRTAAGAMLVGSVAFAAVASRLPTRLRDAMGHGAAAPATEGHHDVAIRLTHRPPPSPLASPAIAPVPSKRPLITAERSAAASPRRSILPLSRRVERNHSPVETSDCPRVIAERGNDVSPPSQAPTLPRPSRSPSPTSPRVEQTRGAVEETPREQVDSAKRASPPVDPRNLDTELVTRAMTALRSSHDPKQAGDLLDRYLRLHQDGTLAEAAWALAIEAAAQRRDGAARDLCNKYLSHFPNGRFAEFAHTVQARD